ncbi:PREDICTED: zinc finger with UFM1-specific peptidase domain protein [Nanorana parkeri]|uniref:zinc finger with UFM1-specific peptidase domain protein n=1 Tax=Nanorana parkeri TaxID=125878 RepID=UPI0008542706|nr:PREDICTED: zinc finger with UFM1-specific peptidase domain protein [Nanorana parkeri]
MFICDICTQEVQSEDDMKSHLLLAHMERDCCCPFCTITGLAYDELSYHINTAHRDTLEPWSSDEEESGETQVPTSTSGNLESPQTNMIDSSYHIEQTNCKPRLPVNREQNNTQQSTAKESMALEEGISEASGGSPLACSPESVCLPLSSVCSKVCRTEFNGKVYEESDSQASASARPIDYNEDTVMECPFCCDMKTSVEELEFHVRVEHADLVDTPTKGTYRQQLECPMCSIFCANFQILQEHVNLHLEEGLSDEASADKVSRDFMLARQLQADEDKKRRAEESEKEKEEFRKLQRQFGLDNSGGYRQQSVQSLERAVARGRLQPMEFHLQKAQIMESIATGLDDGKTKTSGVLDALRQYYNSAAPEVNRVWLCSPLDHFSNAAGDNGWGCGFRNLQMLLSSVLASDSYRNCAQGCRYIPCIPKIQALIENAWKEGFDPQGASHFRGKLQGTRAWIGACEIYCLLTSMNLKCRILDFHKPSSSSGTHPLLFEWVQNYYSSDAGHTAGKVMCSTKPAIYLQHQGHSRTIVGIEERKNKSYCLLIFDPGHPPAILQKLTKLNIDNAAVKPLRKHFTGLKHKQYQIVAVEGALSPEEKAVLLQMSKTFRAERIP